MLAEVTMPAWATLVISGAAVITAITVIWKKVLYPGAKLVSRTEEMLPLLHDLTIQLKDTPDAFKILKEVVVQLRTNGGSSLLDIVRRLDKAAEENKRVAEELKVQVEVTRELAAQDRKQLERLVTLLNYVDAKLTVGSAQSDRMEAATSVVAADLKEAHERADLVEGDPGASADAFSQSAP